MLPNYKKNERYDFLPYLAVRGQTVGECGCVCEIKAASIAAMPRTYAEYEPAPEETNDEKKETECGDKNSYEYEPNSIEYSSIEYISANNSRALMRALRTNGAEFVDRWLCASEDYTPDMDISAIMPFVDRQMWLRLVSSSYGWDCHVNILRLRSIVGGELAVKLLTMTVEKQFKGYHSPNNNELNEICGPFFEKLQSLIVPIPIVFRDVTDATSLCGDSVITAEEWYGNNYDGK